MLVFQLFAFAPLVNFMGAILVSKLGAVRCLIWLFKRRSKLAMYTFSQLYNSILLYCDHLVLLTGLRIMSRD